MKWWVLICLCLAFPAGAAVGGDTRPVSEQAVIPALIPALRIEGELHFCGEKVPLHNQEVRERLEKELLLTLWDRAQVVLWIKRSGR
jgi:hypothetical protein